MVVLVTKDNIRELYYKKSIRFYVDGELIDFKSITDIRNAMSRYRVIASDRVLTWEELYKRVLNSKAGTYWNKSVKSYAIELLDKLRDVNFQNASNEEIHMLLLGGATNWSDYSYNYSELKTSEDIARRVTTKKVFESYDQGRKNPNKVENWFDVQANALAEAERLIFNCISR